MSQQEDSTLNAPDSSEDKLSDSGDSTTGEDERGDVAEADAPTSIQENAGMNTILSGGLGTGVQTDSSDE
jgi:hypothetical protein